MSLEVFKEFLADPHAGDMFITGVAGTGKTTGLAELATYCLAKDIDFSVCAFTHKACGVLADKLPPGTPIRTLHSYLQKRPVVDESATSVKKVQSNVRMRGSEELSVLMVDEYFMVGERDLMDVREAQDDWNMKVVWIGDKHQLPPVGDAQTLKASGKYTVELTTIHRQKAGNPLLSVLAKLVSFIDGATPEPLQPNEAFQRGEDIVARYLADTSDRIVLAYSNRRVQELNAEIQGYSEPKTNDDIFSPTTKKYYRFIREVPAREVLAITTPTGIIKLGSKYKTLEFLVKAGYKFADVLDSEGQVLTMAYVFGHGAHKELGEELKKDAAQANKAIGPDCKTWAAANANDPKAVSRRKAWRSFLAFDQCVVCLDFVHALTVHKSQGSTYENVYVDTDNLGLAASFDYLLYLRLLYVALSRASKLVVTN